MIFCIVSVYYLIYSYRTLFGRNAVVCYSINIVDFICRIFILLCIMWQNLTRLQLRVSECQPVRQCRHQLQVCCSLHVKLFMLLLSLIIWIASLTLISCCCLLCKLFQLENNKQFSYCARYAVNLTLLQKVEHVLASLIWIVLFLSLFVSNQSAYMHFILCLTIMDCPGLLSRKTAIVFSSSRCQC